MVRGSFFDEVPANGVFQHLWEDSAVHPGKGIICIENAAQVYFQELHVALQEHRTYDPYLSAASCHPFIERKLRHESRQLVMPKIQLATTFGNPRSSPVEELKVTERIILLDRSRR